MRKRYLVLAVIGLVLGYFAKVDYWFEDERDIYFPITAEKIRAGVQEARVAKSSLENPKIEALKDKFKVEYGSNYDREVKKRLHLLKSVSFEDDLSNYAVAKQFYYDLARNKKENLLVRRQALKNWIGLNEFNPQNKNKAARLEHLASFSDEKMLESLTDYTD